MTAAPCPPKFDPLMKPVMLALSVVVPLFNEQDSLRPLVSQLLEAVRPGG